MDMEVGKLHSSVAKTYPRSSNRYYWTIVKRVLKKSLSWHMIV